MGKVIAGQKSIFSFCIYRYLLLAVCLSFYLSGCAPSSKSSNNLILSSVLDAKSQKTAVEKVSSPIPSIPSPPAAVSPSLPSTQNPLLNPPEGLNPKELSFLYPFPPGWKIVNAQDAEYPALSEYVGRLLPQFSRIWKTETGDLFLAAGKVPLRNDKLLSIDQTQFEKELDKLAESYKVFYQRTYRVQAEHEIKQIEHIYFLKLKCIYNNIGQSWIDYRYILFFNPDYRLNILISGRESDFQKDEIALTRNINSLIQHVAEIGQLDFVPSGELPLERLTEVQIEIAKRIIVKLDPLIRRKEQEKNLAKLRFEEMYALLDEEENRFLKAFLKIDPVKSGIQTKWQGLAYGDEALVTVENQPIKKGEDITYLPPQFVPPDVFDSYEKMMGAMQKDIGKRLYIESAYRSSAYQLYLFIFFMQKHDFSIRKTAIWNALPGYSEHGKPKNQALDFINESGINGEDNPSEFEALPEYDWLVKNAHQYNFVLSYPRKNDTGIGFEPWHWRYEKKAAS